MNSEALFFLKSVGHDVENFLDTATTNTKTTARIREAMRYSLLNGGKRLRPALTIAACEACGGERVHAVPTGSAIECIHTYSLIHDDLPCMDDDDTRRGKPSCHIKFGVTVASKAGAGLLTLAFKIIAGTAEEFPGLTPRIPRVITEVGDCAGAPGMVGGQVLDMLAEGKESITVEELEAIHLRKTAALLRASVVSGALLAGAQDERIEHLKDFAVHLGLAFQIVDDILDIESTSEELGKPAGSDEERGKMTYPRLLGLDESKRRAESEIEAAYESLNKAGAMNTPLESLTRFVLERRN